MRCVCVCVVFEEKEREFCTHVTKDMIRSFLERNLEGAYTHIYICVCVCVNARWKTVHMYTLVHALSVERERERERETDGWRDMRPLCACVMEWIYRMNESGKKVRYLKKTGETLPSEAELRKMMEEKMEAESKKEGVEEGAAADAVVDVEKKSDAA